MGISGPETGPESNSIRALELRKETLVWQRGGVRDLRQMLHFREGGRGRNYRGPSPASLGLATLSQVREGGVRRYTIGHLTRLVIPSAAKDPSPTYAPSSMSAIPHHCHPERSEGSAVGAGSPTTCRSLAALGMT